MRTIGILGGSFNPPHTGHMHIARATREATGADEVWLWLGKNIFKDPAAYAPLDWRLKACNMMARQEQGVRAIDMEKDFCDLRTATTMTMLSAMYPKTRFIWIFGEENFATFHNWNRVLFEVSGKQVPDWQYMMHNFPIVVMQRTGFEDKALVSEAAQYGEKLFLENPADLGAGKTGWTFVPSAPVPISSSEIRQALRTGEVDPKTLGLDAAVERSIRENGLFGVSDARPMTDAHKPNNEVRFDAFLTLARMTNLCKAVMAKYMANTNAINLMGFAARSWDKTAAKGELGKTSEVPGELADNLISLHWLVTPLGVRMMGGKNETQYSVNAWCNEHYPNNTAMRLESLIEEMTELCVCENLEKHRLLNLMRAVFVSPDIDTVEAASAKAFDTLNVYASHMNLSLGDLLDEKMAANRLRNPVQSQERLAAKRQNMSLKPQGL